MDALTLLQHALNLIENSVLYSLIAIGFYLVSIAARHFAFAASSGFIIAPYIAFISPEGYWRVVTGLAGLGACAILGRLYSQFSLFAERRGAGEGELLIISLAIMGIVESIVTIFFGSSSLSLLPFGAYGPITIGDIAIPTERLVVIILGLTVLAILVRSWYRSLGGIMLRGLIESPMNLALRGYPVRKIESAGSSVGFALIGLAGLFGAVDGRVKPAMCIEIGVVGAVIFIVANIVGAGPKRIILASFWLAFIRLILSLALEGNWSMTAVMFLLAGTLLHTLQAAVRHEIDS